MAKGCIYSFDSTSNTAVDLEERVFKVLVPDNDAYYASEEMMNWCELSEVEHKFIAPYQHQSVGFMEQYHQTLINRIWKMKFLAG